MCSLTLLSDRDGGEWRGGRRPGGRNGGHWDYQNTHRDKHTHEKRQKRKKSEHANVWIIQFKPPAVEDFF